MGNTPSSEENNEKTSNQSNNMQKNKHFPSAPLGFVPANNLMPANTNANPNNNQQPMPPGWSLPVQKQQTPAQSKVKAQTTAPANTRLYPQPPDYDSILKNEQHPTAPPAPNYPSPTPAHVYSDASSTSKATLATGATAPQFYAQPPKPSQFYAQPKVHAQQPPIRYFSQSGNAAASMPLNSASLGLQSHNWVPNNQNGIPRNAFEAGHDTDGSKLFICRAVYGGDLLPGKVVPNHQCGYVSYNGKEHSVKFYEVLVGNNYGWVSARNGYVPENAVEGGRTSNGEKLYIGRAHHHNSLTPGKVHPSHEGVYIPYGGKEKHFSSYEILVHL